MPTIAQESPANDGTEAIAVTGIRGSLFNSMNLKRDLEGVVDAIFSEDIGNFPSTNLAESLQRIPGVSIDRVNGECSQITVVGFGAAVNTWSLITNQIITHQTKTSYILTTLRRVFKNT